MSQKYLQGGSKINANRGPKGSWTPPETMLDLKQHLEAILASSWRCLGAILGLQIVKKSFKNAVKSRLNFCIDFENENGIPEHAYKFKKELSCADGIIISFAEHNGAYTAAFKNIFDWISRVEKEVWYNKPLFLIATSDGSRGAITVLKMAHQRISKGGQIDIPIFSLPDFTKNFDPKLGITNLDLKDEFNSCIKLFEKNI